MANYDDARYWIAKLQLQESPNPPCIGFFKEMHRSGLRVLRDGAETESKSACTTIYFLKKLEQKGFLHKLKSDEMYFFHRGLPLKVAYIDCESGQLIESKLGENHELQICVPANCYMVHYVEKDEGGNNNKCDFSLYSVAVAPGWEFMDDTLGQKDKLLALYPKHKAFIEQFSV